ncbi:hypothetical protein AMK16_20510 [Streptomyces sp. CB00455]|nr:hypothetical protein AMK16_20510 [Streptomyces sp. CB00455]
MLTHVFDRGTLVVSLDRPIGIGERAAAALATEHLIRTCRPGTVVVKLGAPAVSPAGVSLMLRTQRLCRHWGIPLAVACAALPAQPLGAADHDGSHPPVYATVAQAVRGLSGHRQRERAAVRL